jgi:hypothetical protein
MCHYHKPAKAHRRPLSHEIAVAESKANPQASPHHTLRTVDALSTGFAGRHCSLKVVWFCWASFGQIKLYRSTLLHVPQPVVVRRPAADGGGRH